MRSQHVHPWVFMILILPFGAMGGFLTVALAYLLTHHGVRLEQTAGLIALSYLPHTWKFAWAPIADTTLTRKRWYLIAGTLSAIGICLTGMIPLDAGHLPLLGAVVLVSNVAVTFLGMSVEGLMAYCTAPEQKGRAGGWFQAGNLGGTGLGGGAGLWLTQALPAHWMAGAILGTACFLCVFALLSVAEPAATHREGGLLRSLANVGRDLWSVATARLGFLALVLCFLPIGSGAASNLWSAIAGDWHASAGTVALVTGVLNGVVSAAGCLVGGWGCDRMNRMAAYSLYGLLQALCAVALALAPRTETSYVVFTLVYAFITGLTYAGFSAFVLEAMGMGAAATKYNVYASLSNFPIYYMTRIDGWAHTRWGPSGMLFTEAGLCVTGLVLFLGVVLLVRRRAARVPA
jgi:MFS transporter, PAT family, beta-lactamase induction signal transducer AmpG